METSKTSKVKFSMLRAGSRTYFFDIHIASNNKKYLRVTESRFIEEGKDRIRNSVVLFPEDIQDFEKNLKEMEKVLSEQVVSEIEPRSESKGRRAKIIH